MQLLLKHQLIVHSHSHKKGAQIISIRPDSLWVLDCVSDPSSIDSCSNPDKTFDFTQVSLGFDSHPCSIAQIPIFQHRKVASEYTQEITSQDQGNVSIVSNAIL